MCSNRNPLLRGRALEAIGGIVACTLVTACSAFVAYDEAEPQPDSKAPTLDILSRDALAQDAHPGDVSLPDALAFPPFSTTCKTLADFPRDGAAAPTSYWPLDPTVADQATTVAVPTTCLGTNNDKLYCPDIEAKGGPFVGDTSFATLGCTGAATHFDGQTYGYFTISQQLLAGTVAFWVKFDSASLAQPQGLLSHDAFNDPLVASHLTLVLSRDRRIVFRLQTPTSTRDTIRCSAPVEGGVWYHVMASWQAGRLPRLAINGQPATYVGDTVSPYADTWACGTGDAKGGISNTEIPWLLGASLMRWTKDPALPPDKFLQGSMAAFELSDVPVLIP
jgi:hypothetical protein